jgi:sodium/potassium/calcium exchanger 6
MGNSLGDLVANATVAVSLPLPPLLPLVLTNASLQRMGFPAMAIAACFGGPMLNILLGIGCSGSYIIWSNGGEPYHVEIGRTLLVSNAGLLCVLIATLIAVPLNDYWMSKRLGAMLIAAYVVVLTCTVWVEILS